MERGVCRERGRPRPHSELVWAQTLCRLCRGQYSPPGLCSSHGYRDPAVACCGRGRPRSRQRQFLSARSKALAAHRFSSAHVGAAKRTKNRTTSQQLPTLTHISGDRQLIAPRDRARKRQSVRYFNASRSRAATVSSTFSIGRRSWLIESRSRRVTCPSVRVSTSTVMQNGVPISSCRR